MGDVTKTKVASIMAITPVLLTVHTLIVLALIGFVLIQRSDGGALGLGGGGGGGGGFMSGRGAANILTRTTSVLAALFFATSIGLAFLANPGETDLEVIEGLTGEDLSSPTSETTTEDLLRTLGGSTSDNDAADDNASAAAPLDLDGVPDETTSETDADAGAATPADLTAETAADDEPPADAAPPESDDTPQRG